MKKHIFLLLIASAILFMACHSGNNEENNIVAKAQKVATDRLVAIYGENTNPVFETLLENDTLCALSIVCNRPV